MEDDFARRRDQLFDLLKRELDRRFVGRRFDEATHREIIAVVDAALALPEFKILAFLAPRMRVQVDERGWKVEIS